MRHKESLLLLGIIILAFVVRFYALGTIPNGLGQDETSIGYNAYSIVKTGKDEYGKKLPLYFKAFGEYKLPGYIYLAVPTIEVFGTTPLGVRLPSAIFGFLTVPFFYLFVKQLTQHRKLALLSALFLALNPWHIHFSRAAFEVVPALFFLILGACFFLFFISSKKYRYFTLSALSFIVTMYTYNICRLLAPLLFLLFWYFFKKEIPVDKKRIILSLVLPAIFLFPFIGTFFESGGVHSTSGTLLHSSAVVQARLLEMRSYIVMHNPLLAAIFFNKFILTFFEYMKNILSYFSVEFLFISGSDHGNHGIGNVGMFYLFDSVFVVAGIIAYIKKIQKWMTLMLFWAAAAILVAAYTREAPHGTRGFFLIPSLIILSVFGFQAIWDYINKHKNRIIKTSIIAVAGICIFFNVLYYFDSYYFRFPIKYVASWRSEDANLVAYIKQNEHKYAEILFDDSASFLYTSLLYYLPYSPNTFQKEVQRGPDDSEGFSRVHQFGKYIFEKVAWDKTTKHNSLIVTTANSVPAGFGILKTFYYPERPVVIANGQTILQYPVKDIAYVLVEFK